MTATRDALADLQWHWGGSAAYVQAAALRTAFPHYIVNVAARRGGKPRFEVVSRNGGNPYCLISEDAHEIWRELRAAS